MTKKHSTKRALLTSALSLVLCIAMLAGTTFAWFTDSVTSANNIIKSGNLDVELYHTNSYITSPEKVGGLTDLFTTEEGKAFLWEPGAVVWENFEVANEGTLALKYQLLMNFFDATETAPGSGKTLRDVLKVAVVAGGFNGTREEAQALPYNYSLSTFALEGALEAGASSDVYGVVIYWEPSAIDNVYNIKGGLSITLGVNLIATQLANEDDSFGNDYDANAPLPEVPNKGSTAANINADGSASVEVGNAPSTMTEKTTVDAPAATFKPTDKVEVTVNTVNSLFDVSAVGGVVAALDIKMTVNGENTSADLADGKMYTVTTYISKGLADVSVTYTGTDGKDQPQNVTYDAITGKLTFQTNHFSNYAVSGTALAYDVENDTAIVEIKDVIAAAKQENSTVVIPAANAGAIEEAIETLPAEEQEAAAAVTAAAKIGDVTYTTLADAFAAAKDGDIIVVLNNVAVTDGITTNKAITLDLNGKTVAGFDTITGSYALITNKGALTITGNGTMTVKADINRGWSAYSSVISNAVGGKLIVESGVLEHLGGTDMAYGIDNLTNGKGTYAETVINDGTVKSPYRAIRMFLNGVEAQNILTVNGGTIEGANKSIWMQDPSANANTGKLTVTEKAVLDGEVFLSVTAGSTEWPVEISIAGSAKVTTKGLPGKYRVALKDGNWVVLDDVDFKVSDADGLVNAFANLKAGDLIYINADIDMAGKTIAPVTNNKAFTLLGNGYTISNLNTTAQGLFVHHSGSSAYTFDGVVLKNCSVISNTNYAALFVGDADTSDAITITNCHAIDCTVKSAKYAAAFVGYSAGYHVVTDGPVYSDVAIVDCSVSGGSITGAGSVGAAIAHAGGNVDTTSTISNLKVENVAINGLYTGIVVGTVGVGDTVINGVTYANVTGNCDGLVGRFALGSTGSLLIDGAAVIATVAGVEYTSLADAFAAANGAEVKLLANYDGDLALPAGAVFNGNGFAINGTLSLNGNATFNGHTKATAFSAGYYNRIVTINAGACLEVTGTGRVSVGWGNTFNIYGSITNAKTADLTKVQPSLIVPGLSFVGSGADFNVVNAYIVSTSTSTGAKSATGAFKFNFANSVADFKANFSFAQGTPALVDIDAKDSILNFEKNLDLAFAVCDASIDNSVVTVGSSFRNDGKLSLANGSDFLVKVHAQVGEHGGCSGEIVVNNSTLTLVTANNSVALNGKGSGKLVLENNAVANVGYITDMPVVIGENCELVTKSDSLNVKTVSGDAVVYADGKYSTK